MLLGRLQMVRWRGEGVGLIVRFWGRLKSGVSFAVGILSLLQALRYQSCSEQ